MKVLFTANIPSPYRTAFFNELGKRCDLTVLYERESDRSRNKAWTGEEAVNYRAVFLKGLTYSEADAFCPGVVKYLDRDFDIIVIALYSSLTGMYAIKHLYSRGRRFILSTDGGIPGSGRGFKEGVKRYFISKASAWMSTGKLCERYLMTYGAKRDLIFRYPFSSVKAADLPDSPPSPSEKAGARERLGITEEKVVLSVGQFIHRKGFDVLEEAVPLMRERYPDTKESTGFYVVGGNASDGGGSEHGPGSRGSRDPLNRRPFAGKEKLRDWYTASDLFVLPTREDIWGLVVNEAMAFGLPVITTDRCGSGLEMINDDNGVIVPVEDRAALADAMGRALSGETSLSPEAALETARRYTLETMADRHMEIFEGFGGLVKG